MTTQNFLSQRVLDVTLDRATHRTGTIRWIISLGDKKLHRGGIQRKMDVLELDALDDFFHFEIHNFDEVVFFECMEDDEVVEAIEELGFEDTLGFLKDFIAHDVVVFGEGRSAETE